MTFIRLFSRTRCDLTSDSFADLPSGELDPKPHPNYEYPSENLSSGYQSGNNTHTNSDLDLSHCINNGQAEPSSLLIKTKKILMFWFFPKDLQARLDFRDNPPTSFGPPNRADIPKSRTSTVVDPYKSPRILGLKVPLNRVVSFITVCIFWPYHFFASDVEFRSRKN